MIAAHAVLPDRTFDAFMGRATGVPSAAMTAFVLISQHSWRIS